MGYQDLKKNGKFWLAQNDVTVYPGVPTFTTIISGFSLAFPVGCCLDRSWQLDLGGNKGSSATTQKARRDKQNKPGGIFGSAILRKYVCVYISFVANYLTNILIRYCLMCFDARMVHGMDSLIFILYHHISKKTEKQQWRPKHWCSRDYWRKGQSKARAIGNQGFNFYPLHSGGYEMQWSVLTQMPHHILVLSCNTWLSVYVTRAMSILQVLQVVRSWRWPAHPWVFQKNGGLKTQRCNLRRFVSILQLHGSTVLCCVSRDSGKLVLGPGTTATLKRDLTKKSFFGMLVKVNADNKFST